MTGTSLLPAQKSWLQTLYFTRAAFSIAWVFLASAAAPSSWLIAGALLVVYPAWDAAANAVDAMKTGGFKANVTQMVNVVGSIVATLAMAVAVGRDLRAVFFVFGAWAALAGLMQLGTGLRRWKSAGAQWAMVLSGAQSTLAGAIFIKKASDSAPELQNLVRYAAVGALYFLISASILLYKARARRKLDASQGSLV